MNETEKTKFLQDMKNNRELETAFKDVEKITLSLRRQPQAEPPEQIFNTDLIADLIANMEKSEKPKFYFKPRIAAQAAAAFIIFCAAATGLNYLVNKPAQSAESPAPRNSRMEYDAGAIAGNDYSGEILYDEAASGEPAYAAKTSGENLYIRKFTAHITVKDIEAAISELNEMGGESVNSEYNFGKELGNAYISKKVNLNSYWNYIDRLKNLGEVTYSGETAELATARVLDPEAKIAARRAQYQRLNDILSQIISVEDLDYLERAMIDLEIEIASINSQLYAFNESVTRPVVDVYLNEVPDSPVVFAQGFGEKLSGDFKDSFDKTVNGFKELFIFIAGSFFQLTVVAIIIAVVAVVIKKGRKQ
jgi:hypothetical protein